MKCKVAHVYMHKCMSRNFRTSQNSHSSESSHNSYIYLYTVMHAEFLHAIRYHSVNYALCMCAYQGITLSQIMIRTIRFIRKVHVRTSSKQVGKLRNATSMERLHAFTFIMNVTVCDFKTALQTTSLQCSQQLSLQMGCLQMAYKSPLQS